MVQSVGRRERSEQANDTPPLSNAGNAQLGVKQLWPYIEKYAKQYGADPKVMAGIVAQESGFKNYLVHFDGTGHGLVGLDDNGLLKDFENFTGMNVGRGSSARAIPPELQMKYLAKTIGEMTDRYGSGMAAARAWHRGGGAMNDSLGYKYQNLIQGHMSRLFKGGTPDGGPTPDTVGNVGGGGRAGGGQEALAKGGMGAVRKLSALREGSDGPQVAKLQKMLEKAGYDVGKKGTFDAKTDAAVRKFQSDRGLLVDGIVGQQTWGSMHGVSLPPGTSMLAGLNYGGPSGGVGGDNFSSGSTEPLGKDAPAKIKKMLDIARSGVGTRESGWNAGAITRFTGGVTGLPWCAKFVSWAYRQAGVPLPGGDQWAVASIKSSIQNMGQWTDRSHLKPGMAVTFATHSHIELIGKPVYQGGRLTGYMTIGGNTTMPGGGEGCAYKFRALSELEGGGYPVRM